MHRDGVVQLHEEAPQAVSADGDPLGSARVGLEEAARVEAAGLAGQHPRKGLEERGAVPGDGRRGVVRVALCHEVERGPGRRAPDAWVRGGQQGGRRSAGHFSILKEAHAGSPSE